MLGSYLSRSSGLPVFIDFIITANSKVKCVFDWNLNLFDFANFIGISQISKQVIISVDLVSI